MDYASTPITATFLAGTNSTTINVPIANDNKIEDTETFDLNITIPPLLTGKLSTRGITTAVGRILDESSKKTRD